MWLKAFIVGAFIGSCSAGILGDTVNKTIVNITSQLGNLHLDVFPANSGKQEFGEFNLTLLDVNVTGLDELVAEVIELSVIPIKVKNLTVHIPKVLFDASDYSLAGEILFPFGNKILPLSGADGQLSFSLNDLYFSFAIDFSSFNGELAVSNLTMLTWALGMNFHADNFMGGEDLGWAFNTVLDDCAIVAFDYYKDALVDGLHDQIVAIINSSICKLIPIFCK